MSPKMREPVLRFLRCPQTGQPLQFADGKLRTADGRTEYGLTADGIAQFATNEINEDARRQQAHYDRIASVYLQNLDYPHTQEYMAYLDRALVAASGAADLGACAEICCGAADGFQLFQDRVRIGIGVDISSSMLSAARAKLPDERFEFLQGDATRLPLASGVFDSVVMLGGIHHVNDRAALFGEVSRILKPGGRFIFREPVSDFFLWKWLRAIIYRVSPTLDADTERPLLRRETEPPLAGAALTLQEWKTFGFFGYCLLMNSDVLVFNRLFRFLPGIRALTRAMCRVDELTVALPGLAGAGLIVVAVARKPS
jgi:ubiquinone/menaquinone biosynthesis C-methylase UbiE